MRSADVRDDTSADGGLEAVDLSPDSVGGSEILTDAVGGTELAIDAVSSAEIRTDGVNASEIATDAVRGDEIRVNSIDRRTSTSTRSPRPTLDDEAVGAASIVELHRASSERSNRSRTRPAR